MQSKYSVLLLFVTPVIHKTSNIEHLQCRLHTKDGEVLKMVGVHTHCASERAAEVAKVVANLKQNAGACLIILLTKK